LNTDHDLRQSVMRILQRGRSKAIPGRVIAQRLGFKDDRQIRLVIRELIAEGYPVAAAVQPPMGYFLVESVAEAKEYQEGLKGRLIEDALRLRDFKRGAGKHLAKATQGRLI